MPRKELTPLEQFDQLREQAATTATAVYVANQQSLDDDDLYNTLLNGVVVARYTKDYSCCMLGALHHIKCPSLIRERRALLHYILTGMRPVVTASFTPWQTDTRHFVEWAKKNYPGLVELDSVQVNPNSGNIVIRVRFVTRRMLVVRANQSSRANEEIKELEEFYK